jgi:hypothetical protein
MKKIFATTFCTLMICGLLLTVGINLVVAQDYERTSYITTVTPTIDGKWTTNDEWTDGEETWIGTDVVFRSTHDGNMLRWIVEFLSDTTDDTGDYLEFCMDSSQFGGSSPQVARHLMFMLNGHTQREHYMGDGTGWGVVANPLMLVEWDNSISASSVSVTPHWIYEIQIDKSSFSIQFNDDAWNYLLGVYDASNPGDGFLAWPPNADPDVPEEWGEEIFSPEAIPEGLTFAVMALLTTVSMLVGYKYFIKRKETK